MKKIISFLSLIMFVILPLNAKAGSLSISASTTSVTVGNNVIITVKATNVAGTISLTSSNGSILSGGTNSVWMENETKVFTFKANRAGTVNVTVIPANMGDFDSNGAYTASKSVTINVKNKPTIVLSGDNNLSSLGIEGYELTPEFNKDTLEYSALIAPDTTSINVIATPSHGNANITGNGTREVTDGDNRLEITVTAENGTSKTYVINAKVEEYNPIKVKVDNNEYTVVRKKSQLTAPNNYQETTVKINDEDIPAFTSEISGYTLVALKDEAGNQNFYVYDNGKYTLYKEFGFGKLTLYPLEMSKKDIPSGYTKTNIQYNDQDIIAYKLNKNSKYSLIYAMNIETGKKNIYMYDSKENTVQIYNTEEIDKLNEKIELYFYIIIGLSSLSLLLFILCIVSLFKKKNKKNNKSAKLIEDSIIEKTIDEEEFKRKELSKKEIRKKAREDKKAIKQEQKKMKKSFFTDND